MQVALPHRHARKVDTMIFLSYAREDKVFVDTVADALEFRASFNIWKDSQIEPGSRYRDEIQSALEKSQAVVVFWSKDLVKADFVLDEASPTKEARKLVPVRIDGTQPPAGFGQLQTIDMFQVPCFPYSGNKGLDTLIRALTDRLNQRTDIYTVYLSECESEEYELLRRVASRLKIFLVSANQEHLIFVPLARYLSIVGFSVLELSEPEEMSGREVVPLLENFYSDLTLF